LGKNHVSFINFFIVDEIKRDILTIKFVFRSPYSRSQVRVYLDRPSSVRPSF